MLPYTQKQNDPSFFHTMAYSLLIKGLYWIDTLYWSITRAQVSESISKQNVRLEHLYLVVLSFYYCDCLYCSPMNTFYFTHKLKIFAKIYPKMYLKNWASWHLKERRVTVVLQWLSCVLTLRNESSQQISQETYYKQNNLSCSIPPQADCGHHNILRCLCGISVFGFC